VDPFPYSLFIGQAWFSNLCIKIRDSVIFTPLNATNQNVSWSTSNSSVATVSNGIVSAHAAGTATITATTQDGNKTSTCTVTVTESKLTYYQNKYPGKLIMILPDGGALGQASGDTVIVGNYGNDLIELSNNSNVFVYEQNGGHDVVTSVNVNSGDQNELHFGPGITSADLTFYKEGDDLYISIADITGVEIGSITIVDWYLAEQYKLIIVFDDGTELTPEEVEELVKQPYVPLSSGWIETLWATHGEGGTVHYGELCQPDSFIKFMSDPYNATITSVEWESDVVPFVSPYQAETLIDYELLDSDFRFGYIKVTVNETYTIEVHVWGQRR